MGVNKMHTIKVGFIGRSGVISNLIKLITWGKFSHVYIQLTDELIFETDVLKRVELFNIKHLDTSKITHWELISIDITDEQFIHLLQLCEDVLGTEYDYKLIFKILCSVLFKRKINRTNEEQFICSELVGFILYSIGVVNDRSILSYSPNGLYKYMINNNIGRGE